MDVIMKTMPVMLQGLWTTVEFSIIAIILATVIGLFAALMKLSRIWPLKWISTAYVELFRGTPLLVQLIFITFAMPQVLPLNHWFGPKNYPLVAAAVGLALNEGAYITEIIRAGILGVDRGQREAAQSVGMNGLQTMRYIILPQAFKRMIPPLVNQFAQTIKDTSLLSVVAITELLYQSQIIVSTNFEPFKIYGAAAVLYFIVIFILTRFAGYLERRLQIDKR